MVFKRSGSSTMGKSKARTPLLNEAIRRAEAARESPGEEQHPLQQISTPTMINTPTIDATKARKEWRRHGQGLSQVSEEKRRPQSSTDTVVRILAAETRSDVNGSKYTAYVVSVLSPGTAELLLEHRYSDFDRINTVLRKHSVKLEVAFPSKHWAGRMGNWTPSLSLAPSKHEDLVSYRKVQLDLWLVDVVGAYNRGALPGPAHHEIREFLADTTKVPCDRDNQIDINSSMARSLRWSNPLSFTLGSSIRQAAHTVRYMCRQGLSDSDQSIPLDLLQHAKGLCFLTVMKAGLVVSGKLGTGLVIARKEDGTWGAPSALGTVGLGWGAQIGGDITHYLIVLTSKDAVDALSASSSVTLGAELGVAVGPVGRGATSQISSSALLKPAYAYAHSHGLFVGISLEGSIVNARHDLNTKFYGQQVDVKEILMYRDAPRAAEPLYDSLKTALEQEIPEEGLRPSTLFTSYSLDTPRKPAPRSSSASPVLTASCATPPTTPLASSINSCQNVGPVENINPDPPSLFDTWHAN